MIHKKRLLAVLKDFGYIYHCSCGQFHIHLKGVTIYVDEGEFLCLLEMLQEARDKNATLEGKDRQLTKRQLKVVKK